MTFGNHQSSIDNFVDLEEEIKSNGHNQESYPLDSTFNDRLVRTGNVSVKRFVLARKWTVAATQLTLFNGSFSTNDDLGLRLKAAEFSGV